MLEACEGSRPSPLQSCKNGAHSGGGRHHWWGADEHEVRHFDVPQPRFQAFNEDADNKAWPLVEARLRGNLTADLLPALPEDCRLPWEQHERLGGLVGKTYVVQRFKRPDQLAEGSWALFRGDGVYTYCDSFGPYRWAQIGPNMIVVQHDAESG